MFCFDKCSASGQAGQGQPVLCCAGGQETKRLVIRGNPWVSTRPSIATASNAAGFVRYRCRGGRSTLTTNRERRFCRTGNDLDQDLAFDQWNITACEHEDGVLMHHYLGNIAHVDLVSPGTVGPYSVRSDHSCQSHLQRHSRRGLAQRRSGRVAGTGTRRAGTRSAKRRAAGKMRSGFRETVERPRGRIIALAQADFLLAAARRADD